MIFRQLDAGGDRNLQYLVANDETREAAVIDPGPSPYDLVNILKNEKLKLVFIINTHSHIDHKGGNRLLSEMFAAKIAGFRFQGINYDINLKDGDILEMGKTSLKIIHTPGHTPDSICILAGSDLITGDTLFVGKVGGTGFGRDARDEYDSLHKKLMKLP